MSKVVRARTSPVAAALLVSFLVLPLAHVADADHDPHAALAVFVHNASTHALSPAAPDDGAPPLHCVACHVARSLRPRSDAAPLPAPDESAGAHTRLEVFTAARPAPAAQPPLRSPPLAPESALA